MVKIRVTGDSQECIDIIEKMYKTMTVVSVSKPYKNRDGEGVRYYVEVSAWNK